MEGVVPSAFCLGMARLCPAPWEAPGHHPLPGLGTACPESAVFGTRMRKLSTGSSSWQVLQPQPRYRTHCLEESVFLIFFFQ